MTLDELKGFEDEVANHRQLAPEVLGALFAIARATLEKPAVEAEPVVAKKPRGKVAE